MIRTLRGNTAYLPSVVGQLLVAIFILVGVCNSVQGQELYAVDRTNLNLYKVSTSNAALTLVGNTGVGLGSLEYRPSNGFLYGFSVGGSAQLYRIDPANAASTLVGGLGGDFVFEGGLVLAPNGTAYATNKNSADVPTLFTIDLDTAATNTIGVISGGTHDINGLAWRSDGMLVGLDRETNSLLAINPANAQSSLIAAVAPTIGAVGGMAAIGDSGYFATAGPGAGIPGSNQLYSFNLLTGAHALIGSFLPTITDEGISGLALIPIPEPSAILLAALALGSCCAVRRRAMA